MATRATYIYHHAKKKENKTVLQISSDEKLEKRKKDEAGILKKSRNKLKL